ncbi:MAG: flavin reductase family protein [Bacteroidetes bacterium]|nr:flavin reductase family protein [Bacteroidota bacterium]
MIVDPREIKTMDLHSYMLSSIAPRPIAFASTIDKNGNPNLSPFSFFNAFGSNPPIVVFSPARRVRDNTIKHTLENIYDTKEVVINAVSYAMVHQQSLASCEYAKGVNEFEKAGFTAVASQIVKPFRVKESPVQMECKVLEVKETGTQGGAGNLIICEILLMHIDDNILDEHGKIDQHKIDLVARLGGDWYCRASGDALFTVPKPLAKQTSIGVDAVPQNIKQSDVLSGNNLGLLGNSESLPDGDEIKNFAESEEGKIILRDLQIKDENEIHQAAKKLLEQNKTREAFSLLMMSTMQ